jgi:MscS family membrane protein
MNLQSFEDFWTLVVDVWRHGLLGVDIGRILTAMLILVVFFVIRRLFTRFVVARLKVWASRTKSRIDEEVITAIEKPLSFIPVLVGLFIATKYLNATPEMEVFFSNLNRSLVAFTIFWALYRAISPLSVVTGKLQDMFGPSMMDWLVKAAKIAFVLLGGATILEIWGIAVAPIIAGLGLFGVAVALGAQDLFKNLIAGLFVIGERRFQPGDWILVDGVVEGTVEEIGFRTTRVRRFDKSPVYVPNAKLSDNAVTNFSQMTHRRIYWFIRLEYRTTVDQLRQVCDGIRDYLRTNPDFAPESEVATFVRVDRFTDSSIDIMIYCFTKTTNWGEWLAIKETLALKIKEIVEGAGAGFAFPTQSIYVEALPTAADPTGGAAASAVHPGGGGIAA